MNHKVLTLLEHVYSKCESTAEIKWVAENSDIQSIVERIIHVNVGGTVSRIYT